jgi:hypothetical protein
MKKNLSYLFAAALAVCATGFTACEGNEPEVTPTPTEYTISVTSQGNGTASAGVAKAIEGTQITVSAVAAENYRFASWNATGVTLSNTNPATFTMPAANVTITAAFEDASVPPPTRADLVGSIYDDRTLDASITYTITGPVIVEDGGMLNIPAGTRIEAVQGFNSYILVLMGGKINVNGTAEAPVIMTADSDNAQAGYWGGLIINGKAPLTTPNGVTGQTEISKNFNYGGTAADDSSGKISYLVLAYTGNRSAANTEHNGLTLNGVGSGTEINDIFVYEGSDDGIEFFGGSVDVTNILVYNSDDDMFDFTQGYSGTLKNAYGIWDQGYTSTEADPRGIEADGNLDGNIPADTHQSNFNIENITFDLRLNYFDGTLVFAEGTESQAMQDLMKIRRGAAANISNALVKGTGRVQTLINLSIDGVTGTAPSVISLTDALENDADSGIKTSADYPEAPGVKIEDGNEGCDPGIFDWVADAGYDIF